MTTALPEPATTPPLDTLWLDLTRKCPLECTHCYNDSGPTGGGIASPAITETVGAARSSDGDRRGASTGRRRLHSRCSDRNGAGAERAAAAWGFCRFLGK
ncbi:hypothetical protein GCM10023405_11950 [Streptomonospora salina]